MMSRSGYQTYVGSRYTAESAGRHMFVASSNHSRQVLQSPSSHSTVAPCTLYPSNISIYGMHVTPFLQQTLGITLTCWPAWRQGCCQACPQSLNSPSTLQLSTSIGGTQITMFMCYPNVSALYYDWSNVYWSQSACTPLPSAAQLMHVHQHKRLCQTYRGRSAAVSYQASPIHVMNNTTQADYC